MGAYQKERLDEKEVAKHTMFPCDMTTLDSAHLFIRTNL